MPRYPEQTSLLNHNLCMHTLHLSCNMYCKPSSAVLIKSEGLLLQQMQSSSLTSDSLKASHASISTALQESSCQCMTQCSRCMVWHAGVYEARLAKMQQQLEDQMTLADGSNAELQRLQHGTALLSDDCLLTDVNACLLVLVVSMP